MSLDKKSYPIYILKILEEFSDEDHPLLQSDILDKVFANYNIKMDRKTVATNIQSLIDAEFDVHQVPRKGYYLNRDFDTNTVKFLLDAVNSSKLIGEKESLDLNTKLKKLLPYSERNKYRNVYKMYEKANPSLEDIFNKLDLISEAISKKKLIKFHYRSYDKEGKPMLKKEGYKYPISPYYLFNFNGEYYLIGCFNSKLRGPGQNTYNLNSIIDVEIAEDDEKNKYISKSEVKDLYNFDITRFVQENVYPFKGKSIVAKVLCKKDNRGEPGQAIKNIIDRFGDGVIIKYDQDKDETYAHIRCVEESFYYWAMQYADHVEVLSPKSLVDRIEKTAKNILKIQ